MGDEPPRQPRFWPVLFITAFLLGTILWCLWMVNIVRKTRAMRDNSFFVPTPVQDAPAPTNAPIAVTNGGTTNSK